MICLWQKDKLLGLISSPTGWNRDTILLVDGMAKLAGVESLVRRVHWRVVNWSILTHFPPLLTTFLVRRQ